MSQGNRITHYVLLRNSEYAQLAQELAIALGWQHARPK